MTVPFTEPLKREENQFKNSTSPPTVAHVKLLSFSGVLFQTLTIQSSTKKQRAQALHPSLLFHPSNSSKASERSIKSSQWSFTDRHTENCNLLWYKTITKTPSQHYHTGALSLCVRHTSPLICSLRVCVEKNWGHCFKEAFGGC